MKDIFRLLDTMISERENSPSTKPIIIGLEITLLKLVKMEIEKLKAQTAEGGQADLLVSEKFAEESNSDRAVVIPKIAEEDYNKLYHELLLSVETKHPNESRHETALRYIQTAEHNKHSGDKCNTSNFSE